MEFGEHPIFLDQSKHALWKPTNLPGSAWKEFNMKIMKTTFQEKRNQVSEPLQLCAQDHSCASSNEDTGSKSSGGQREGKARDNASVAIDERQEQEKGYSGGTQKMKNSPFCDIGGRSSSQKCGVGITISRVQRPRGTPR